MLVSQLANQWRDIRNVVAGVDLRGGLRSRLLGLFRSFLLRSFLLWLLLVRVSRGLFLLRRFALGLFLLRFVLWSVLLVVAPLLVSFSCDASCRGSSTSSVSSSDLRHWAMVSSVTYSASSGVSTSVASPDAA